MIPVSLAWKRPVDGMELDQAARATTTLDVTSNEIFVPRTDRTQDVAYEVTNLEDPIVMRFVNAHREDKMLEFLSRFGRLSAETMYRIAVEFEANLLLTHLLASTTQLPGETVKDRVEWVNNMLATTTLKPSFDYSGPGQTARVVLHPQNLLGLMAMEVALAHEAGAAVGQCANCGKLYLTGPLTSRRSSALYCSDRCRVASNRKAKKEGASNG